MYFDLPYGELNFLFHWASQIQQGDAANDKPHPDPSLVWPRLSDPSIPQTVPLPLIAYLPSTHLGVKEIRSPKVQVAHPATSQRASAEDEDAQEALGEAIRAAMRAYTGLILAEGYPMRGIAFAERKLLTVDEPYPTHLEVAGEGMNSVSPLPGTSSIATPPIRLKLAAYPPSGPARLRLA